MKQNFGTTNPPTQEYREAAQMENDRERAAFVKTLSPEQRKQFKAVEKAVKTLLDAGVWFYMFPLLPAMTDPSKLQCWQWNSLTALMPMDADGKQTPEGAEKTGIFHSSLFSTLFWQFTPMLRGKTPHEQLSELPYLFHHCLLANSKYMTPPEPETPNEPAANE